MKVTFRLDEGTVGKLSETAERLSKPKSPVVPEAIDYHHAKYHGESDRLAEADRVRMLHAFSKDNDGGSDTESTRGESRVRGIACLPKNRIHLGIPSSPQLVRLPIAVPHYVGWGVRMS